MEVLNYYKISNERNKRNKMKKKEFKSCKIEVLIYNALKNVKAATGKPISRLIEDAVKNEYKGQFK